MNLRLSMVYIQSQDVSPDRMSVISYLSVLLVVRALSSFS